MSKKTYTVVYRLKHDGTTYKPGDTIQMDSEQAIPLLSRGALADGKSKSEPNSGLPDPMIGKPKEPEHKAEKLTADPGGN